MQGMRFTVPIHLHGTLAANAQGRFQLPCAAVLQEVSAVGSNAHNATLQVGTSAAATGIMTATAIGVSGTPTVWTKANFNGALYTDANDVDDLYLADNTIMDWVLDFDGAAGTAGQNVTILFTFVEG